MKLHAYSDLQEPQVKHARANSKPPGPIDLAYEPQDMCAFLRLPRELRDQIYEDAFGEIDIGLVHQGVEYFISDLDYWARECSSRNGLPQWVRTCKQMTEEAIEVLTRTCSFRPLFPRIHRLSSNPLVFRPGNVRSIIIEPDPDVVLGKAVNPLSVRALRGDPSGGSLTSLEHLQIKEGQLHIIWSRWWHQPGVWPDAHWYAPEWLVNEPGMWTEDWTDYWAGRFRKVSIAVVVHTDPDVGDVSTNLVRLAETLAKRLVGPGGTPAWKISYTNEFSETDGISYWTRCVTVERKT